MDLQIFCVQLKTIPGRQAVPALIPEKNPHRKFFETYLVAILVLCPTQIPLALDQLDL